MPIEKAKTYSDFYYKSHKSEKPKFDQSFKNELPGLLKQYKEKQDSIVFSKILLLIDALIIRMINQLRYKWDYLKRIESTELYNCSIIALHDACCRFEIRNKKSIYSFPIFLKTYINRELQKSFYKEKEESIEYDDENENMAFSYNDKNIDVIAKEDIIEKVNKLSYSGQLKPQYACILKLRLLNKSSSEIAKRMKISVSRSSFLYKKSLIILKRCIKNGEES